MNVLTVQRKASQDTVENYNGLLNLHKISKCYNKIHRRVFGMRGVVGSVQKSVVKMIKPLTPELKPSSQRCLTRYFIGDFAS
jgi:hypothetical protein